MKIIIITQPDYRTGGVEALYQLCHTINEKYNCAYIYFVEQIDNPVPEEYKKYNIKIINKLEDISENLIIVPEVWTEKLADFKNSKVGIWWLSVDNNRNKFKDFQNPNIYHFYQSEYAKDFLIKNNVHDLISLSDYITDIRYTENIKENIICYNPAKGKEATDFVIHNCTNLKFIPLVNMSKEQITEALNKSKLYIDFGHHPGKDRIPREAALCKNIVLTSYKGSAKFYEDVPIPNEFKWKMLDKSVEQKLFNILNNYKTEIKKFENYFKIITNQKKIFQKEVDILITKIL
jgi:hypothetical protein